MITILRTAILLCAAVSLASCDSPTGNSDDASEVRADQAVEGTLDSSETDYFDVRPPDADFRLLLQARSGSAADTLIAELLDSNDQVRARVASAGTDTALVTQASEWVAPEKGTRMRVRVRGQRGTYRGAYSMRLFVRDPRPENVPAALTPGQTVEGERLEVEGDVDEFRIAGQTGQEWVVFAQVGPSDWGRMHVQLVDSASGQVVREMYILSHSAELEQWSTGRVVLTRTGTYLVRLGSTGSGETGGPYRLRLDVVNRAPEEGPASLALGAVASDAIDGVGDVDEFTFTGRSGQEMNLMVQLQSGMSAGLNVELLRGEALVASLGIDSVTTSLDDRGTGRIALPADGEYRVRVYGPAAGTRSGATGRYRFELYPVDRRPETGGPVRLDAAPVPSAIDRPGDVDEFPFQGTAGQYVVIHLAGVGTVRGAILAELVPAQGARLSSTATSGSYTPTVEYSVRTPLPYTGAYTLRISGLSTDGRKLGMGSYTLEAYTVSAAPEHVPGSLQVGQTVTGERIDRPGDLDVFTFAGEAGRTVNIFLGQPETNSGSIASLRPSGATQPAYTSTYAGSPALDGRSTGRIALEAATYQLTVEGEAMLRYPGRTQEPYGVRIFAIDTRPEGRSAAYVPGETVSAEPLYPAGDIDEYTFDLGAQTRLRILWDAPFTGPSDAVLAILRDDRTGGERWNSVVNVNGELLRDITLPAGRYRLNIKNPNGGGDRATLGYRFAFLPQ